MQILAHIISEFLKYVLFASSAALHVNLLGNECAWSYLVSLVFQRPVVDTVKDYAFKSLNKSRINRPRPS